MWMLWKEINSSYKCPDEEYVGVIDLALRAYGTNKEHSDYPNEIPNQSCMKSCNYVTTHELKRKDHFYSNIQSCYKFHDPQFNLFCIDSFCAEF